MHRSPGLPDPAQVSDPRRQTWPPASMIMRAVAAPKPEAPPVISAVLPSMCIALLEDYHRLVALLDKAPVRFEPQQRGNRAL